MEGLSERAYAAHSGLSRGAVQKARKTGRLVLFSDGSINAAASDARRGAMTDPDQQMRSRGGSSPGESAVSGSGDSTSYLKARTALTVYQAQEAGHCVELAQPGLPRLVPPGSKLRKRRWRKRRGRSCPWCRISTPSAGCSLRWRWRGSLLRSGRELMTGSGGRGDVEHNSRWVHRPALGALGSRGGPCRPHRCALHS